MIKEVIDWSLGGILDSLGSREVNSRENKKWRGTVYEIQDKETGEIIGDGEEWVGAPSGNTIWFNRYNQPTTLRKRFREKIGWKPGTNK